MSEAKHDEHEGHDHAHSGEGHGHAPKNFGTAFVIGASVLEKCCKELHEKFEIQHATIQFEIGDDARELAPEGKV